MARTFYEKDYAIIEINGINAEIAVKIKKISANVIEYEVSRNDYMNRNIYHKIPAEKLNGSIEISKIIRKHYLGGIGMDENGEYIFDFFHDLPETGDDIDGNLVLIVSYDNEKIITKDWVYIVAKSQINQDMCTFHRDKQLV